MNELYTFLFGDGSVIMAEPFSLGALAANIALTSLFSALSSKFAPAPPKPKRVPGFRANRPFEPLVQPKPSFLQTAFGTAADFTPVILQQIMNKQTGDLNFQRRLDLIDATQNPQQNIQTPNPVTGVIPTDILGAEIEADIAQDFIGGGQIPGGRLKQDIRAAAIRQSEVVPKGFKQEEVQTAIDELNQQKVTAQIDKLKAETNKLVNDLKNVRADLSPKELRKYNLLLDQRKRVSDRYGRIISQTFGNPSEEDKEKFEGKLDDLTSRMFAILEGPGNISKPQKAGDNTEIAAQQLFEAGKSLDEVKASLKNPKVKERFESAGVDIEELIRILGEFF